ncbi:MAG: protein kinase [Acidobacteria bacterium]|nr:protein kinase [Acidobacteriota bacterium]
MIGQKFGHYRIVETLGQGGMGVVYRAYDERLERDVCVKVLHPGTLVDEAARQRFRNEALALSRLNHPNIATVHDFDTVGEVDFVVMEYIAGTTLALRLRRGALPESEVAALGTQILAALEEAHDHGVIHRDLKPGNIMVTPKGQVKVLDFGLAKLSRSKVDPDLTVTATERHMMLGTLPYMSPEQLMGQPIDARSDLWAAGVVLYEMATGQRPFPTSDWASSVNGILNRTPRAPREVNPRVSVALEAIICKALEKDPARRYESSKEMLADQHRLLASPPPADATAAATNRWPQRRTLVLGAGLVALALSGWVGLQMGRWRAPASDGRAVAVLVADFENRTGEPVFDQTLRELLTTSLEQSRHVDVFPSSRVSDVLRRMGHPGGIRIDESVGREICQREGLQAILLGSISRLGASYVIVARAVDVDGFDLVSARRVVADASRIPGELDAIVQHLRTGLGEPRTSVARSSAPLEQVSSPSLAAIRHFTQGKEHLNTGRPREAIDSFQQALALDAGFAMARAYLGVAYSNVGDPTSAEKNLYDASQLTDRVTEIERLKILGDYNVVAGFFDEACTNYKVLAQMQPRDPAHPANLGLCYEGKLDFDAAIAETERALQIQPIVPARNNLARYHLLKGDSAKAISVAEAILREHPADQEALSSLGQAHLVGGNPSEARRAFEAMVKAGPGSEPEGRMALADLALGMGRVDQARTELMAAVVAAERTGNRYVAPRARIALGEIALLVGAERDFGAAIERLQLPEGDVLLVFLQGRLYARGRRLGQAGKMLAVLADRVLKKPTPRLQSFYAMLQAELAVAQRRAEDAVESAQRAVRFESSALAVETLARAFAAAGQTPEAIREYARVLGRASERAATYDEPGFHHVVWVHYRLGLLYQASSQPDRAQAHLEEFMKYWSGRDATLEMGKDAERRLLELRSKAGRPRGKPTPVT